MKRIMKEILVIIVMLLVCVAIIPVLCIELVEFLMKREQ